MFCSGYFTKLEASLFIFMLTMSLTDLTYALCFIEKKNPRNDVWHFTRAVLQELGFCSLGQSRGLILSSTN